MGTWIQARLMEIMFTIDNIIYSFISTLYELLLYLANLNLFGVKINDAGDIVNTAGADMIAEFTQRIYILLGIFMLFKVSFSILQYLVSPDTFSDKSKGMGKLITNVLVALVLLVLTPSIFSFAYEVQGKLLNSNAIPKLIFGTTTGDEIGNNKSNINKTLATDMQFLVFGSFFTVNTDLVTDCGEPNTPVLGTKAMAAEEKCVTKVAEIINSKSSATIGDFFRVSDTDDENRKFESFGSIVGLSENNQWYFKYSWGFSTIAGLFIVVMLLSYCIAIAIRAVKLFFLQVIAPIPIISYVDPKQGKDGALMKWAKECGKTYISLFIRIALIFLAFYLIDLITTTVLANDISYYNEDEPKGAMNAFVTVMLILGTLIFANQVPKLLEEIFGLKFTGEYSVNPLKKIKDSTLATGAIAGTVGLATGSTLGALNAYNASKGMGRSTGRSIASGLGGVFSGAARGVKGGIQGRSKAFGLKSAVGSMGAIADSMNMRKEAGIGGQFGATLSEITGAPYKVDQYDEQIKKREEYISYFSGAKKRAESIFDDDYALAKQLKADITAAENSGNTQAILRAKARYEEQKKLHVQDIIENGAAELDSNGNIKTDSNGNIIHKDRDSIIKANLDAMQRVYTENPNLDGVSSIIDANGNYSWKQAKDGKRNADNTNVILKADDKYENAKARKDIRQKSAKRSWINTQNK